MLVQEHGCELSSSSPLCGALNIASKCSAAVDDSLRVLSRQYLKPDEAKGFMDCDFFADYEVSDNIATIWEEIQDDPAYAAYCEFLATHTAAALQREMPNTIMSTFEQYSTCTINSDLDLSLPLRETHGVNLDRDIHYTHKAQPRSCASSSIDCDIPRTPCPHEVQLLSSCGNVAYPADNPLEQSPLTADPLE